MAQATFKDTNATDAIDRPVKWNGEVYTVVGVDAEGAAILAPYSTIVSVKIEDCIPLCLDCHNPLQESDDMYPGVCHTEGCFLRGGG